MSEQTETPKAQPVAKDETITIKKETLWKYSTFILAGVVIVGLFFMLNGGAPTAAVVGEPQPSAPSAPSAPSQVNVKAFDPEEDYYKGDIDAPITIYEYSDYECPFCGRFYQQTLPSIQQEWIDSGKAKLVMRDFPLSFHPQAQPAAEATECAGEQDPDAFWEMHDVIFENQQALSAAAYSQWAADIGLDVAAFDECMESGKYRAEAQEDMQSGQAAGVRGTPGFVIEGPGGTQLVSGAQPFAAFETTLNAVA